MFALPTSPAPFHCTRRLHYLSPVPAPQNSQNFTTLSEEEHAGQVILEGKTALILGYGAVGKRIARGCLGMVRLKYTCSVFFNVLID